MVFTRKLRPLIAAGEVTCSVRIWMKPHVKVGGRYPMEEGFIVVESIEEIDLADIDQGLARRSGFESVEDLMATARHGAGHRVFLVKFRFESPALG